MAIRARSFRIEALGDLILGLGGKVVLVLEDENLVGVECFTDYVKVGVWKQSARAHW
jgi:high-affinity K+ transport system ATPase subunit B